MFRDKKSPYEFEIETIYFMICHYKQTAELDRETAIYESGNDNRIFSENPLQGISRIPSDQ
jgi:hypothetical protein